MFKLAVSNSINPTFTSVVLDGGVQILVGTGAPSMAAAKGSLYIRTDGSSSSTRLYVCSVATGTWVNVTTAS